MMPLFSHKFNKSPFNQNSKLTIGEVSFILEQTVVNSVWNGVKVVCAVFRQVLE